MSKFKKMLSEPEQGEDVEDIQEANNEDITESEESEAASDTDLNEYEDASEVEAVEKKPKRDEKRSQIAASRKRKESNAKQSVDQAMSYPQKETQKTQKTQKMQKAKLSEHVTLLAAIGAVVFSALAVFSNNSLSTKQYNTTTQGLWKAQKGQFAVLRSESSDALTQLNDKLTALDATQSDIKAAMKRLNENVQTLNKNLNQVQENMLGQMKQIGTPDLSKIESAISAMNTDKGDVTVRQQSHPQDKQAQHLEETQIVDNENNENKENEKNKTDKKNRESTSDLKGEKLSTQNKTKVVNDAKHTVLYLGNTPNGAVIKLDDEYLTVQVGQKTVVGTVTLISNKQIVIGNASYVYQAG